MNPTFAKYKAYAFELLKIIIISAVIIVPVRLFLIHPFIVKGISMENTFENNDYLIVNRFTYHFNTPQRGDIIVFKSPLNLKDHLIKRVIGMPGETIEIRSGYVFVKSNTDEEEKPLDESFYLGNETVTYPEGTFVLDDGYYFVLGDNRGSSMDSRLFGPVHESLIVGRVWVRGWPFDKVDTFDEILYPNGL